MQTALNREYLSVDDYLAGEEATDVKHEYIDGSAYAMAGASTEHNQISLNIALALRADNWAPEMSDRINQTVNLNALNFTLPLSNIYEGVFPSAPNPS